MLTLALAMMTGAYAADDPQWTITVDPLTFAIGYPHLQIEGTLSDKFSLYAGPHARLFDGILTEEPEPFRGYGIESGLRYFPKAQAPTGMWLMYRQVVARINTTEPPEEVKIGGYSSALVGYTGILADFLVLAGGAGFNYLYYDIQGMGASGPFIALHTNIGVAF